MKLWTGLAAAMLCAAQVFAQPTFQDLPINHQDEPRTSQYSPISTPSNNLPITWSRGYLALTLTSAPNDTILSWDADTAECGDTVFSPYFRIKNFGTEAVTVCAPVEPESLYFSRTTDCQCYASLAPGEMLPCSARVAFFSSSSGVFRDTMRMETNANNSYGGFVRIPLVATCVSTPESPDVVINIEGTDANLYWQPIRRSVSGCPVTVHGYFVFYSPYNNGVYTLLDYTADTTYVHSGVILTDGGLFYQVVAGADSAAREDRIPRGETLEQVLRDLK